MSSTVNKFDLRLNPQSPMPLYAQIGEAIRQAIEQGEFKPGDFLPTNRAVAEALNVDQKTVHRAFAELHRQKLVGRTRGRGTYVLNTIAHSGAVGLVCDIGHVQQFWMVQHFVQQIQGYCASHQRRYMLYAVSADPTIDSAFGMLEDDLKNRRLALLLFLNWNKKLPEIYEQAQKQRLPVISLSAGLAEVADYVVCFDMLSAIQDAIRKLAAQNKKRVGVLFNVQTRTLPDRDGLVARITEAGGQSKVDWLAAGPCTQQGGYEASAKLDLDQLDAVIVTDDHMGMGLEQRLLQSDASVRSKLELVVISTDKNACQYLLPIRRYVFPQKSFDETMIRLLDDVMSGKRVGQSMMPVSGRFD